MSGPTHRVYAINFAFITAILLDLAGISEVNYYLSLIIILYTAKAGALFPDLDHQWQNVKEKTIPNKIINTLIHVTGGHHRSWQTHSIDICLWFTIGSYFIPLKLYNMGYISLVNKEVATIIFIGFSCGWISHIFADMLNYTGVKVIFFLKIKARLVPKQIGKLKFKTGEEWEEFNFKFISMLNKITGFACLIYPIITSDRVLELIKF